MVKDCWFYYKHYKDNQWSNNFVILVYVHVAVLFCVHLPVVSLLPRSMYIVYTCTFSFPCSPRSVYIFTFQVYVPSLCIFFIFHYLLGVCIFSIFFVFPGVCIFSTFSFFVFSGVCIFSTFSFFVPQVQQQLPQKKDQVLHCDLIPPQRALYQRLIQQFKQVIKDVQGKDTNDGASMLMQLRKASNHPLLLRNHYNDEILLKMAKKLTKVNPAISLNLWMARIRHFPSFHG